MHCQNNCVITSIFKAGEEYANTYIISPSSIAGRGSGPVGRVGVLQMFFNAVKESRRVTYIGEGTNVFGAVSLYAGAIIITCLTLILLPLHALATNGNCFRFTLMI